MAIDVVTVGGFPTALVGRLAKRRRTASWDYSEQTNFINTDR